METARENRDQTMSAEGEFEGVRVSELERVPRCQPVMWPRDKRWLSHPSSPHQIVGLIDSMFCITSSLGAITWGHFVRLVRSVIHLTIHCCGDGCWITAQARY